MSEYQTVPREQALRFLTRSSVFGPEQGLVLATEKTYIPLIQRTRSGNPTHPSAPGSPDLGHRQRRRRAGEIGAMPVPTPPVLSQKLTHNLDVLRCSCQSSLPQTKACGRHTARLGKPPEAGGPVPSWGRHPTAAPLSRRPAPAVPAPTGPANGATGPPLSRHAHCRQLIRSQILVTVTSPEKVTGTSDLGKS